MDREVPLPEAARLAGVDQSTFWRWIQRGEVAAVRVGRRYRVLESVARGCRQPVGAPLQAATTDRGATHG